ncbi:MAG: hypothetical protein IJ466_09260, partial [Clostridia bacterium]|nr:hypothetical protein [Clostridia bacterium]
MRKKTEDMLGNLRKISGDFAREAQEIRDRETREEQRKRYEAEAQFMNAYSSEHVPEVPAEPKVEAKPEPAPEQKSAQTEAPAPQAEPAKAEEARPAPAARPAAQQQGAQPQQRYGRPAQPGQQG